MKTLALTLALLPCAAALARADEVALLTLRAGKDKQPIRVAIELHEKDAPQHAENFRKLARKKFYNGLAIHRSFPHTLVQIGDPLSEKKDRTKVGTGGPGYTVPAEIRRKHTRGAVAAARLPDKINPSRVSNGSQFYICLKPMPELDGQYTVFGQVLYGLEALDQLSTRPVDSNDYPVDRIEVQSLRIVPREELPPAPPPGLPAPAPAKKPWWKIWS